MKVLALRFPIAAIGIGFVIFACDRKTQSLPPAGTIASAHDTSQTHRPLDPTAATSRRHFNRHELPKDIARQLVEDQLRATALDSAHCISPRTLRCGALEIVSGYHSDSTIVRGDTATVLVRYSVVGRLEQRDSVLFFAQPSGDSSAQAAIDTVVVSRDSTGWSLLRNVRGPRVSALLVALYFALSADDEQKLLTSAGIDSSELGRPRLVDPRSISILTTAQRDTLWKLGCRVPMGQNATTGNVIHGSFLGAGTNDWAVFCGIGELAKIFVFRDASGSPAEIVQPYLARVPSLDKLPNPFAPTGQPFGCGGTILTMDAKEVRPLLAFALTDDQEKTHLTREELAAPVHDAIMDSDCDGLGQAHYWTGKRWVRLPGTD